MTLAEMSEALQNVSLQQLHKYEIGANRIPAARLLEIATALNVPVSYFFSIIEDISGPKSSRSCSITVENVTPTKARLIRALMRVDDRALENLADVASLLTKGGNPRRVKPARNAQTARRAS
jgi:transcriptional regulator with XRE-family HTH domain